MNDLQLKEKITHAVIEFDKATIEKAVADIEAHYNGFVVTESDVTPARKDMSSLRTFSTAIEDARKRVKKEISKPYEEFEKYAKSLVARVEGVRDGIATQIDNYDTQRKNAKRADIEALISKVKNDNNALELQIVFDEKWLAKDCKNEFIKNCVENQIFKHKQELLDAQIRETAKRDRMELVNRIYKSLCDAYGFMLNVAYMMEDARLQDLTATAEDIEAVLIGYFDKEQEKQAPKEIPNPPLKPVSHTPPTVAQEKTVNLRITYDLAHRDKLNQFFEQIKDFCKVEIL